MVLTLLDKNPTANARQVGRKVVIQMGPFNILVNTTFNTIFDSIMIIMYRKNRNINLDDEINILYLVLRIK